MNYVYPKIELHLHFEGAIPLNTLRLCAQRNSVGDRVQHLNEVESRFHYDSFADFRRIWKWKNQFLRKKIDFESSATAFAAILKHERYVYAEVFISPTDFALHSDLTTPDIVNAICSGLRRVDGPEIKLIVDLVKSAGPELAMQTLDHILLMNNPDIIGVGLGGDETIRPSPFKRVFEKAKGAGLMTTIHAGESLGSESIWEAITELPVDRIGHAVSAIEDDILLEHLANRRIPLELCPTSNEFMHVIPSYTEHPIRKYFELGLLISVNTDDPVMFRTTLDNEFSKLRQHHGFQEREIRELTRMAIDSSWASKSKKSRMLKEISQFEAGDSVPEHGVRGHSEVADDSGYDGRRMGGLYEANTD